MKSDSLRELQELAATLWAAAHKLPPGKHRANALEEIAKYRQRISALQKRSVQNVEAQQR